MLFLDNWYHQFLDGVGDELSPCLEMIGLIGNICVENGFDMNEVSMNLIQSAIKGVASYQYLYKDQEVVQGSSTASFSQRVEDEFSIEAYTS